MTTTAKSPGRAWVIPAILCAVTLAVYAQVAGHLFVTLDDPALITANGPVRGGLTRDGPRPPVGKRVRRWGRRVRRDRGRRGPAAAATRRRGGTRRYPQDAGGAAVAAAERLA